MGTTFDHFYRAKKHGGDPKKFGHYYAATTTGTTLPSNWLVNGFTENGLDYTASTIVTDLKLNLGCFSYRHPETKELLSMVVITADSVHDRAVDISGGISPQGFGMVGSRSTLSEDLAKDMHRNPVKYSGGGNFFAVEMVPNDWSAPSQFVIVSVLEPFGIGFVDPPKSAPGPAPEPVPEPVAAPGEKRGGAVEGGDEKRLRPMQEIVE